MGDPIEDQIAAAVRVLGATIVEPGLLGVFVYGSAAADELRPDSDIDLLALTSRRLDPGEKRRIIEGLIPISDPIARPGGWRSLDVSVANAGDLGPWRYPPTLDLQYGEWRRAELVAGSGHEPADSPDLTIVLAAAQETSRTVAGERIRDVLDEVPREDLRRAMLDEVPRLLEHVSIDTRNVILTLARIWVTLETGRIASKSGAATWVMSRVPSGAGPPIARARDLYLGGGYGVWDDPDEVEAAVDALVAGLRKASRG